jgi:Kef-type K+ transport system membrane component KefB
MIARSPSSIIAIIKETKAKGPYTQLALHITVVSDIVVVVLFSIAYSLGVSIYDGKAVSMLFIPSMILNLGMSIGLAVVFAFVLTQLFKVVKIKWIQLLFILGACYLLYPLQSIFHHIQIVPGQLLELEPILMGIWVGIFIRNMTSVHHEFEKGLQTMSTPIFTIFFTLTGLTLALSILSQLLFIAIIIFCLRFIGLFSGSVLGGILTGVRKKEYFYLPLAHITQAGVSIGLARSIQEINPEWGTAFYTMALSAIIITQFVGPIAFKFSLNDLGESENGESKAEQSFSYAS